MKNFILRFVSSIILLPFFLYIIYRNDLFFILLLFFIFLTCIYEIFKNIKNKIIIIFLLLLLFIFIFSIYNLRQVGIEDFAKCVWIFSIVWLSDVGGYFFGKIFGGIKLSKFSPNKTISGLVGSIILSQIAFYFPSKILYNFTYGFNIFLTQLFLCIVSVFGDIFFSYIKRKNNIKDYSNLIPGHGGLLDRIDGFIFVIIFGYIFKLANVL